ncbi:MAG: L-fucose/L-arabinose isomerase family protein, partial [Bacteroidales bacterium]|nr:L-fucose/L-arabinose isomerase family protein [Bacteroidales bacterium]
IFPRAARNRNDIEEIVAGFNADRLDGIMIVMLTYGPGMRIVRALQENNLPVLLTNTQPVPEVTNDWNMDDLTYNQGIHGAQDISNALMRTIGSGYAICTGYWKDPDFKDFVNDWSHAAMAASRMKGMKIAEIGKMHDMGDTIADEAAFMRMLGPVVHKEYIGQVYRNMSAVTDDEIDKEVKFNFEKFKVDDDMPEKNHRYAVRMYLGFKKLLEEGGYSAFSAHFDVFKGDGRFEQIPMYAASRLMAEGYGYAAEGDTNTATMVAAGHLLADNAHFTEMYAMDFKLGSMLMSHMGEGNYNIARKDQAIRLANRVLGIGDLDNPPTCVFQAEPGEATFVSLVSVEGEYFRLVVAHGEILDTKPIPFIEMPYFHFKPDSGLNECNNEWLRAGGTHHQTLHLGDTRRKWEMLCDITGMEYIEV